MHMLMWVQVRNCRLGMLAALGFAVQAWVTGKGPIQNAVDHLRDPFGQNSESARLLTALTRAHSILCVNYLCVRGMRLMLPKSHIKLNGSHKTVQLYSSSALNCYYIRQQLCDYSYSHKMYLYPLCHV
jgi:hypothetical protein